MFKKITFFLCLLSFWAQEGFAQRWKANRHELYGGLAAINFIGELGGANDPGNLDFIRNLNFTDTRPGISLGYRYRLSNRFNARFSYNFGVATGDDAKTENIYRNVRNLSFRAPIHEFTAGAEFYFISDKATQNFKFKGVKYAPLKHVSFYSFVQAGAVYFNPQAEYNGKWINLQPLGTEGQGLIPGTELYSRVSFVVPYGFGFKYDIFRGWGICVEYGSRLLFTDYMDDVSTVYFDNEILRKERGDAAADLADRNITPEYASWTSANQQRGNPDSNDFYLFATATITYKIPKGGNKTKSRL